MTISVPLALVNETASKPLDCASYPFFPVLPTEGEAIEAMIKGSKCPLPLERLGRHAAWVHTAWQSLVAQNADIKEWLRKVELLRSVREVQMFGERNEREQPLVIHSVNYNGAL